LYVYDEIVVKQLENIEYGNQRIFYTNLNLKHGIRMEFAGELKPEGALISFTVCDAYRYFSDQA